MRGNSCADLCICGINRVRFIWHMVAPRASGHLITATAASLTSEPQQHGRSKIINTSDSLQIYPPRSASSTVNKLLVAVETLPALNFPLPAVLSALRQHLNSSATGKTGIILYAHGPQKTCCPDDGRRQQWCHAFL